MRKALIKRKTNETDISLSLDLDGNGIYDIETGCGFLDHMLELFSSHGKFNITLKCIGDTDVDFHHSVEDVGICLGQAFSQAIGDRAGIERYCCEFIPMDEALVMAAVDISGRSHLSFSLGQLCEKAGSFDTELVKEFMRAFVRNSGITLHIKKIDGTNTHHIIEAAFKAFARSLSFAASINQKYKNEIPSTKGVL